MDKKTLPNEHKLILLCTRLDTDTLIQKEIKRLLNSLVDWHKFIELSTQQEIFPFSYYTIKNLGLQNIVPRDIFETMKDHYYFNLKRNLMIEKEVFFILGSINSKDINIIPFRGFNLIQTLYHDPGLRIMSDVDVLIKEGDFQKIKSVLGKLGYREKDEDKNSREGQYVHVRVFSKRFLSNQALHIEIHNAISPARPYRLNLPRLWQRTEKKTINYQKLLCLSPEDMFLSFALHLRRHTRRLTLKFIVDIAEFLEKTSDKLDWDYIAESAKNNRILTTVYFSLYITMELFATPVSSKILNRFRPNIIKKRLLFFLINKHNFFALEKWRGVFLRLLLFDTPRDFLLYLWRVSFLEKHIKNTKKIAIGEKIKK